MLESNNLYHAASSRDPPGISEGAVLVALNLFPGLGIPKVDFTLMLNLLPMVIVISLLGFMEAISISKAMAAMTGQRLDPNQE